MNNSFIVDDISSDLNINVVYRLKTAEDDKNNETIVPTATSDNNDIFKYIIYGTIALNDILLIAVIVAFIKKKKTAHLDQPQDPQPMNNGYTDYNNGYG